MTPTLVHIERLHVRFAGLSVLGLRSLRIPGNSGLASIVLGANGAGKSTLLNAVSGYARSCRAARIELTHPLQGEVDLRALTRDAIVRVGVARTFQSPTVLSSLTVREGVALAAAGVNGGPLGLWRQHKDNRAVDMIISSLGLSRWAGCRHDRLSHHALVLAEMARCLATQPRLLLVDEPSAGADDGEKADLVRLLSGGLPKAVADLRELGAYRFESVSVVLVTHDLPTVDRLVEKCGQNQPLVHVLDRGEAVASGRWMDVRRSERANHAYFAGSLARA